MLALYDDPLSGNGYKARLMMAFLGIPYRYRRIDIMKRETRTTEFLAINPNGRIPVLILEDGTPLAESNAILCYLADGTPWIPSERLTRAQVLGWMFFEQYSHEPNVATLRFWNHLPEKTPLQESLIPSKTRDGNAALKLMNDHLSKCDWLVGDVPTIADIALYAYTHVAEEGGFALSNYPAVQAWLDRMAARPGYVPMDPPPSSS